MSANNRGNRLAPLDSMRGLASLAVVVYHFGHFGGDVERYPWARAVVPGFVYLRGWLAVDFFFVLSGVVLTYRYFEALSQDKLDAREFFVLRVSRLYPLHLLTLLFCAAIQWTCLALDKPEILYTGSNLYQFFLNLVYLNSGVFEETISYNGPSWSVAVEVVAYVAFFLYASKGRASYMRASIGTMIAALAVMRMEWSYPLLNSNVARGLLGFFVGSLLFFAIRHFKSIGHGQRLAWSGFSAMLLLVAVAFAIGYDKFVGPTPLALVLVVFPLVILSGLEISPLAWALSLRPLTFLGELSYAIYLVHVPVQMVMLGFMRERHREAPVTSGLFLGEFLATVLVVAFVAHKLFEVPARAWVRGRFGASRGESPLGEGGT